MTRGRLWKSIVLLQLVLICVMYMKRRRTDRLTFTEADFSFNCRFPDVSLFNEATVESQEALEKLVCKQRDGPPPISHCGRCSLCLSNQNFSCNYREIYRKGDFKVELSSIFKISRPIQSDFAIVSCYNPGKDETWRDVLMTTCGNANSTSHVQAEQNNLVIFGLDSVSRLQWPRLVPKSYNFAIYNLSAIEMKGYSIVGDGTTAAILGLLTGKFEHELPEPRRGFAGAMPVDDFPWIWKKVHSLGYKTHWAEDLQGMGTFQLRLLGFRRPPVIHYMRPFYLYIENELSRRGNEGYCLFGRTRLEAMLSYYNRLLADDPNASVFSFMFHSAYSHDSNKHIPWADDDLLEFLKGLDMSKTSLILMSDHGRRFAKTRTTSIGRIDERSPLLLIRLSDQLIQKYPHWKNNLVANAEALTTPFDLHATLLDLMTVHSVSKRPSARSLVGSVVSYHRTCADADIPAHWCVCKAHKPLSRNDKIVDTLTEKAINYLNQLTVGHPCSKRRLKKVWSVEAVYLPNATMSFVESADRHGRRPRLKKYVQLEPAFFELTFETSPDGALFEMSLDKNNVLGLSRLNAYGKTSKCVAKNYPALRPICYCEKGR